MATLPEADRFDIWAEFMRELSGRREALGVTKDQLRQAVDAADQWANDNAASFNTALPAAFRTAATPAQKAMLLMYVVGKRFLKGV